jgi:uncharacterized membrane protein
MEKNKKKLHNTLKYQTFLSLFMVGSVLGYVVEGLWSIVKVGHWENHAATLWGPFSIIYGFGTVAAYLISLLFSGKHILLQFMVCCISGTLVEYFSGLFQKYFLGSASWDYRDHFLNIGGQVSLQMAIAWGLLGVLFMRLLFPILTRAFEKLNNKKCALLCAVITAFMLVNLAATTVVILRWRERINAVPAQNSIEQVIDSIYDDEKLEQMFTGMRFLDGKQKQPLLF